MRGGNRRHAPGRITDPVPRGLRLTVLLERRRREELDADERGRWLEDLTVIADALATPYPPEEDD